MLVTSLSVYICFEPEFRWVGTQNLDGLLLLILRRPVKEMEDRRVQLAMRNWVVDQLLKLIRLRVVRVNKVMRA
jgi:hypothetical protein